MTTAVCLQCGRFKIGALACCPHCRHEPVRPEDRARHILLTDRFLPREELEKAGRDIQAGKPILFDEQQLQDLLEEMPSRKPDQRVLWLMLLVIGLLFLLLIAGGALILRLLLGRV